MTWREAECVDCGNYVTYGMYYSEHEHDATEITVTVKCGYCVTGTNEEGEQIYEFPETPEWLVNNADLDEVEDEKLRASLELARDMYNKSDENKDVYATTFTIMYRGAMKT